MISLRHALNKTQYNIFYMFADPLKLISDELYKKIKAINNVDNNLKYYIYKNKRKIKNLLSEEESCSQMRKNIVMTNSLNYLKEKSIHNLQDATKEQNINNKNNNELINTKLFKNLQIDKCINNNKRSITKNSKFLEFNKFAKLTKLNNEYKKIVKGKLDEELVVNTQIGKSSNENNKINRALTEENKKIPLIQLKNDIDKNNSSLKDQIFKSVKADNKIFNNCLIKKKIIYDIKPLNKLKEKGKCNFPKEETDIKNKTGSTSLTKNSFFERNIFFEEINKHYNLASKNNTNENLYKDNSFNNIIIKKHDKNKNYKNKHSKSFELREKEKNKTTRFFHLKNLYKDLPTFEKKKNIFIYYKNGVGVSRGEKLKFLKTSYPMNLIKPLDTQQFFKLKMPNKIRKNNGIIIKKFPVNHYYLDIIKRNNKNLIKGLNTKRNNISEKIKTEFLNLFDSINDNDIRDIV